MKYKILLTALISLFIGGIVGYYVRALVVESMEEVTSFYHFKAQEGFILNDGTASARIEFYRSWVDYVETHDPLYSVVFSHPHSKDIEKALAYYRIHEAEEELGNHQSGQEYLDKSLAACATFTEDGKCTVSALVRLSCVFNTESDASSCLQSNNRLEEGPR